MRVETASAGRLLVVLSHGEVRSLMEGISTAWTQSPMPAPLVRLIRQLADTSPPFRPRAERTRPRS